MPQLPPPPVPQGLRNMLKDYPEHIERLQDALNVYSLKPFKLMPFDGAIWALEGRLETFCLEADEEMEAAKASNDLDRVAQAKAKQFAFSCARTDMGLLTDMQDHIRGWVLR